ncbi:hypothetical protein [Algoriphagus litoralis]|uniref:hypothetical protein n=1 Tax=Algoriphagus litoralis TaxID=2202829 RepID=UPI00130024DE|nr:hypothetical protein [Algoriphagus litoralis]
MQFIQSEVYSNLYLVKYPDKDYSKVQSAILEKIQEYLKTEHQTGKPLAYTNENGIYFYELGGRTLGFIGDAGTGYFIDHEEDLGGFVSEELGMYTEYRLAEFYYDSCPQDSSLVCGEIAYFKEGDWFKTDSLHNFVILAANLRSLNEKKILEPSSLDTSSSSSVSIEQLKRAFAKKNEAEFLNYFPGDFQQFISWFGWNTENGQPADLYAESGAYLDYFFESGRKESRDLFEEKLIGIAKNGYWQEDGVNYFQDFAVAYIKKEKKYELINELSSKDANSVLFFLFDGPHPKFDADFASQLSPPKKEILVELFESGFYDQNKNPDPILPDPETLDLSDDVGSIHYALSDFEGYEHYFIRDIDINNDGTLDKIVSADRYQGDELFLFVKKAGEFQPGIKTINFSEDGGNQIVDITAEKGGFVIKTAFPDGGLLEAYHHIRFKDNAWVLTNTVYKTQSSNGKDAMIYVCDVVQELDLEDAHILQKLRGMPEEQERRRRCTVEKVE